MCHQRGKLTRLELQCFQQNLRIFSTGECLQILSRCNAGIVVEHALQLLSFSLYLQILPFSYPTLVAMVNQIIISMTTQALDSRVPHQTRNRLLRTAAQNAAVCVCVCVVNTQGVLEKQPNYRSVIYAIPGSCLQLLRPSLFIRGLLIAISVLPPFQFACIIRCVPVSTYRIFLKTGTLLDVR